MGKKPVYSRTTLEVNEGSEGELLIHKVDRIVNSGEPVTDGTGLIYTPRSEGVMPEYNIRADRRDIAVAAMDIHAKARHAKREDGIKERQKKSLKPDADLEGEDGKPKSTDTTEGNQ